MGQLKICHCCGRKFLAEGKGSTHQKFCSSDCRNAVKVARNRSYTRRKQTYSCQFCHQTFTADRHSSRSKDVFCSISCAYAARRVVGREFVGKLSSGNHELFIKVNHGPNPGARIKRKAVVMLEELFRRPLSHLEKLNITFLNGNRLDCSPNNLVTSGIPGMMIRVCPLCGKESVIARRDAKRSIYCKECRCCLPKPRSVSCRSKRGSPC